MNEPDTLRFVFGFLCDVRDLFACGIVCRLWRSVSRDKIVWTEFASRAAITSSLDAAALISVADLFRGTRVLTFGDKSAPVVAHLIETCGQSLKSIEILDSCGRPGVRMFEAISKNCHSVEVIAGFASLPEYIVLRCTAGHTSHKPIAEEITAAGSKQKWAWKIPDCSEVLGTLATTSMDQPWVVTEISSVPGFEEDVGKWMAEDKLRETETTDWGEQNRIWDAMEDNGIIVVDIRGHWGSSEVGNVGSLAQGLGHFVSKTKMIYFRPFGLWGKPGGWQREKRHTFFRGPH